MPKKPAKSKPEEKLTRFIKLSVTEGEYQRIAAAARKQNRTMANVARACTLSAIEGSAA